MGLENDFKAEVTKIFKEKWETRNGTVVPESNTLKLANDGVNLDATVLYADLDSSTALVDGNSPQFAAQIYKAYLHCAAKVIRSERGEITAYDGDRIMAVYLGSDKDTAATRTALKINHVVKKVINKTLDEIYPDNKYRVRQVVGIDTSPLFVTRTGIRGANDLVWVGRAANYAAKLCSQSADYPSYITADVYNRLDYSTKSHEGRSMWQAFSWTQMKNMTVYRSEWTWAIG